MKNYILLIISLALLLTASIMYNYNKNVDTQGKQTIEQLYLMSTVVTEIDTKSNSVIVENANGHLYAFSRTEDWKLNDVCVLLMDNNNTTNDVTDDIIIKTEQVYKAN